MSLYYKAKRMVKLGVVCALTYYVAKGCSDVVLGQEQDGNARIGQDIRTLGDDALRGARQAQGDARYHFAKADTAGQDTITDRCNLRAHQEDLYRVQVP